MIKVGRDYIQTSDKERKLNYCDIRADDDGWVDAKMYLPADYDLMYLRLKNNKTIAGWSVASNWDGLKLGEKDEVLYWKRKGD